MQLRSNVPTGPIETAWDRHRFEMKLVNPANKRKFDVIVVGTGLAGASAAATMGELGYNVKAFCFQDSPRRAHSIAAQGGINAAKNYKGTGTAFTGSFTTPSRGGTSDRVKQTCTALHKSASTSSTRLSLKGSRLRETMVDFWTTAHLVVRRYRGPFMRKGRPGSNC